MATEVLETSSATQFNETKLSKPLTTTKIPLLTPSSDYNVLLPAPLKPEEEEKLKALKDYVETILLPVGDPRYEVERRWVSDQCLKRYLRAAKWNLREAKQRVLETLEWRRDYKPDQIDPKEVEPECVTGKIHFNGFDRHGRPILYLRPGLENTKAGPRQIKNTVFAFERGINLMPAQVETIVLLVDFDKTSLKSSPGIGIAKEFVHILGSHYPERLGLACVIDAPWYFSTFYKLISPFIDNVTKEKFKFTNLQDPDKGTRTQWLNLDTIIDKSQLESEYGGENAFVYDHKTYWNALLEATGL
ncbi:hypothetical protein G9A89_002483 [Geosiphon pyriformis]|nr:hypothetical protein G9A89_002483 [Geosiphon pyriformis]